MRRKRLLLCLLALLMFTASAQCAKVHYGKQPPKDFSKNAMELLFLDTHAPGDAFVLRCGGKTMMIDSGHVIYVYNVLATLHENDIYDIDYLFATHMHADHMSAFRLLMYYGYTPERAYLPNVPYKYSELETALGSRLDEYNIPYDIIEDGMTIDVGGATVDVMRNPDNYGPNSHSACTMITFGDAKAFLTSDIDGKTQQFLIKNRAEQIKADILKFPHHGYETTGKGFVSAIAPQLIVVTNDNDSKSAGVRQVLQGKIRSCFTLRGTIVAVTDGNEWYVYQQRRLPAMQRPF